VLEIDVQGARQVREALPDATQVFIAPPSTDALRQRLVERGADSEDQIRRRLDAAADELAAQREFGEVVVNDDLQQALAELTRLTATIVGRPAEGASS
jgi:guanylate kinase